MMSTEYTIHNHGRRSNEFFNDCWKYLKKMLRVLRSSRSSCIRRLCTEKIKTDIDIEKDLFVLKRRMGGFHSVGNYKSALEVAEELQDKVKSLMGEDNAMYASCLNNVALMQKYLGKIEESVEAYTQALHIYEDAVGKKHSSYAITLANLGASYKVYAETSKGMEKMQLLERAKEALEDAQGILKEVNGT
jgi:tetratricopeptide (TPR) repeat protein